MNISVKNPQPLSPSFSRSCDPGNQPRSDGQLVQINLTSCLKFVNLFCSVLNEGSGELRCMWPRLWSFSAQ